MEGIEHRIVKVNGINMHIAEKGQKKGPLILFLHGFPELWYSWRHQITSLASLGYHAVAPDLRGFGDTDAPDSTEEYTCHHVVGDLIALLDAVAPDQEKEPGVIEAEFAEMGTERVIKEFLTYRNPGPLFLPKGKGFGHRLDVPIALPNWLSEEDVDYYATKFDKKGFTGGINYYRNMDKNWELTAPWTGTQVKVPVKFIVGDQDLVYCSHGSKDFIHNGGFKKYVPMLEEVVVMEGVAYFINQEKPDEISKHIHDFIKKFH